MCCKQYFVRKEFTFFHIGAVICFTDNLQLCCLWDDPGVVWHSFPSPTTLHTMVNRNWQFLFANRHNLHNIYNRKALRKNLVWHSAPNSGMMLEASNMAVVDTTPDKTESSDLSCPCCSKLANWQQKSWSSIFYMHKNPWRWKLSTFGHFMISSRSWI